MMIFPDADSITVISEVFMICHMVLLKWRILRIVNHHKVFLYRNPPITEGELVFYKKTAFFIP